MLNSIYTAIDTFLIFFFRLPEVPIMGYMLGIAVLAVICVLLGHLTMTAIIAFNGGQLRQQSRDMVNMQNLSIRALLSKDKPAYKLLNREANEAFGKYFFAQIAVSASSLWPLPFALGWLQMRFEAVEFMLPAPLPLIGDHVGYAFSFIPMYILMRLLIAKIKGHLPQSQAMRRHTQAIRAESEKMISYGDLSTSTTPRSG